MGSAVDYDDVASEYDRRYSLNEYPGLEQALVRFAGAGGATLEVGCGTGHWLAALRRRGWRAMGVDSSAQMLFEARRNLGPAPLVRGRAERLPLRSACFDRMFCINAVHHFEGKRDFLREARRLLRPGGALMVAGLDPLAGLDRWSIYDFFAGTREADERRYPSTASIREWMSDAGFADCRSEVVEHLLFRMEGRKVLEEDRLSKRSTSQLALLSDDAYGQGIERVRRAVADADARGETCWFEVDLRLFATFGHVS